MANFNDVDVDNNELDVYRALNELLVAVSRMDPSSQSGIASSAKRFWLSGGAYKLQRYNGSAWGDINLNVTHLGGQPDSFYRNASNLSSGTLPAARLPSSINASTLNGLTSAQLRNWTGIINKPAIPAAATQNETNEGANAAKFVTPATLSRYSGLSNAETLDNQDPDYYLNASNLSSGTLPAARLPSSINASTLNGLTSAQLRNWTGITNKPAIPAAATQNETNAGTNAAKFVTPATLSRLLDNQGFSPDSFWETTAGNTRYSATHSAFFTSSTEYSDIAYFYVLTRGSFRMSVNVVSTDSGNDFRLLKNGVVFYQRTNSVGLSAFTFTSIDSGDVITLQGRRGNNNRFAEFNSVAFGTSGLPPVVIASINFPARDIRHGVGL